MYNHRGTQMPWKALNMTKFWCVCDLHFGQYDLTLTKCLSSVDLQHFIFNDLCRVRTLPFTEQRVRRGRGEERSGSLLPRKRRVTLAGRKVISHLSPPDMKIQTNTRSIKRSWSGQNGNNPKKRPTHPGWSSWCKIILKKRLSSLVNCCNV